MPIFGSIVQKGKFAAFAFFDEVKALKSVDLPTLGKPTIPHLNPIQILIYSTWEEINFFINKSWN